LKNFQQDGTRKKWTNGTGADVTSGTMVKVGNRVGVCAVDIANGASGTVVLVGVFSGITKLTADVVTEGVDLYWDDTNKRLTLTSTSNTLAGFAWAAADGSTAIVTIKINA